MSFTIATIAMVGIGAAKGISGFIKGRKAKKEQAKAQAKLDERMSAYENLDTSNPYADLKNEFEGMENTFEDLTVNTQEAEFQRDAFQQSQANIMGSMESGGQFTAGNIQALAGAGEQAGRKASASIGAQESANEQAAASGAADVQSQTLGGRQAVGMKKGEGKAMSQQMEADKQATLLGMAQEGKGQADANKAAASEQMWSGISSAAGAFTYKDPKMMHSVSAKARKAKEAKAKKGKAKKKTTTKKK